MFLENSVHGNKQFGSIEVICGSMFSGKTEELIRRLKRAKIANQKIQIFKRELSEIYSPKKISNSIASTVALSTFLSFFTLIVVVFISLKYFN